MNERLHTDSTSTGHDRHLGRDRCRDLLHGLLPPDEEESIVAHAASCSRCEDLLQEMVAERERLRAMEAAYLGRGEQARDGLSEGLGRWLSDLAAAIWQPRYRYATALAAVAAVLLLVLWPYQGGDHESMQPHWLPAAASDIRLRDGAEGIADEDLAEGLAAYASRDLNEAIARLQRAELTGPLETIRRVYLGNALAMSGEHHEALELLRTITIDPLPDPWRSETLWTLYVALRASGRADSADSLLRRLALEPLEIGERARRQLRARER
jgi:hypothetical protein